MVAMGPAILCHFSERPIMKRQPSRICMAMLFSLALLGADAAMAQAYPVRPIRILVPLAAGSTADILSRAIGEELARELGQAFVVDNKTGAGGSIAMAELAHAAPDGYTIGFASQGTLIFNLSLYSKPGYDSSKDFAPILLLGGVSNVMVVPPAGKARSVPEVIAAARAKPGGLTFSSGGSGTSHHLSGVLFGKMTGSELLHVPYKGAPQGILAVMAGEVDMGFYNTPTVLSQIRSGKLRALAVTSLTRSALLPEVPTVDASGVKGYEINTWFGFVAPAGTPPGVIARLTQAGNKALASPAIRDKLAAQGVEIAADQSPAAFSALIADDLAKWPALIKASGAKVD